MSTRDFNLSGFTRINVRFATDVEIIRADTFSVSVSGSDTLIDNVDVHLEGDRLVLGYHMNLMSFFTVPFSRSSLRVTMPDLRELNITGAVRGTMWGFSSNNELLVYVVGASHLELTDIAVGSLKWDLSGASRINGQVKVAGDMDLRTSGASGINLRGSVQDIYLDSSGASHIDLQDLAVRNARVRLSGASRCYVNVNGKLDVDISGTSSLEYAGQVAMGEVRVTGASTLKKR